MDEISQDRLDWLQKTEAITKKGISVEQGMSSAPVREGSIVEKEGSKFRVYHVRLVDDYYFWHGAPYEYSPEDPCDEDFMSDITEE